MDINYLYLFVFLVFVVLGTVFYQVHSESAKVDGSTPIYNIETDKSVGRRQSDESKMFKPIMSAPEHQHQSPAVNDPNRGASHTGSSTSGLYPRDRYPPHTRGISLSDPSTLTGKSASTNQRVEYENQLRSNMQNPQTGLTQRYNPRTVDTVPSQSLHNKEPASKTDDPNGSQHNLPSSQLQQNRKTPDPFSDQQGHQQRIAATVTGQSVYEKQRTTAPVNLKIPHHTVPGTSLLQNQKAPDPVSDYHRYNGRIVATVTGPSVYDRKRRDTEHREVTTSPIANNPADSSLILTEAHKTEIPFNPQPPIQSNLNPQSLTHASQDVKTNVAADQRFVTISELSSLEKEKIDKQFNGCLIHLQKTCTNSVIERIKELATPVSVGNVSDQPYLIVRFDEANDKSLDANEVALRKSLQIQSDNVASGNLCRFARFKKQDKQTDSGFHIYEFYDYTPYLEKTAPRYNTYLSSLDDSQACGWTRCYCKTLVESTVYKNLNYALLLAP